LKQAEQVFRLKQRSEIIPWNGRRERLGRCSATRLTLSRDLALQSLRHAELKTARALERGVDRVFGVSIISCWEVAKLVEYGRLRLDRAVGHWIESALAEPGVLLTSIRKS
jgi:PIN domain nuclease of toxin-antitoxin system